MTTTLKHSITGSGPATKRDAAAGNYWTADRRAAAEPVHQHEAPSSGTAPALLPGEHGPLGHLAPSRGKVDVAGTTERGLITGVNQVSNPLAYPYTTCGKLFFTQNGSDWVGSASMVAPNILLTAGHCVFEGGWSTNVEFYPSYPSRDGSDPAYRFGYSYAAAWTAWTQNSDRAYDYGMVWIDGNPGQDLGWLGLMWNADTSGRNWDAVGYPATPNPPFDGASMQEALGSVQPSSTAGTIGLSNDDMEHGSSGGPWITDFNGSPREYANGLQSFHINDGDFTEYGPYFTDSVKGLFDWISDPANRK